MLVLWTASTLPSTSRIVLLVNLTLGTHLLAHMLEIDSTIDLVARLCSTDPPVTLQQIGPKDSPAPTGNNRVGRCLVGARRVFTRLATVLHLLVQVYNC